MGEFISSTDKLFPKDKQPLFNKKSPLPNPVTPQCRAQWGWDKLLPQHREWYGNRCQIPSVCCWLLSLPTSTPIIGSAHGHTKATIQHTMIHTLKNNLTVNLNTLTISGIQAENSLPLSTEWPNSFTSLSINVFHTLNIQTTLRSVKKFWERLGTLILCMKKKEKQRIKVT